MLTLPTLGNIIPYMGNLFKKPSRLRQAQLSQPNHPTEKGTPKVKGTPKLSAQKLGVPEQSMIDALFSSTQQRVLGLIFTQPNRKFFAKELIELCDKGSGSVQRELARLVQVGLVSVEQLGKSKFYSANQTSPIFPELQSILIKTVGLTAPIKTALLPFQKEINSAFVFGSVAKASDTASSDIDLFIVSESLGLETLYEALLPIEAKLARRLNVTLYSPTDFELKLREKNSFIENVLSGPTIHLLGKALQGNRDAQKST